MGGAEIMWLGVRAPATSHEQGTRKEKEGQTMKVLLLLSLLVAACAATPLDDYVNAPDPTYEYRDLGDPWDGDGYTSYFINLTSQLWLSRETHARTLLSKHQCSSSTLAHCVACACTRSTTSAVAVKQPRLIPCWSLSIVVGHHAYKQHPALL